MEIIIGIIATIAAVVGTYFAWVSHKNEKKKPKELESKKNSGDELSRIKEIGKLKVGYFDYPPLIYSDASSQTPVGLYAELLNTLGYNNALEIEWNKINLSDAVKKIVTNEIDLYVCIFETPRRAKDAKFVSFLHSIGVSGIAKKDFPSEISLKELRKRQPKYVVCKNEIGNEIAEEILKVPKSKIDIIDTNNISSIVSFVKSGYSDIAIADSLSCWRFIKENPESGLKLIEFKPAIAIYNTGFMVNNYDDLFSNWVEMEIDKIVETDEFVNMESKQIAGFNSVINRIR